MRVHNDVIASLIPPARSWMAAELVRAVLASDSCKITFAPHYPVLARVDRVKTPSGIDVAVVDCGDVDLLIT